MDTDKHGRKGKNQDFIYQKISEFICENLWLKTLKNCSESSV